MQLLRIGSGDGEGTFATIRHRSSTNRYDRVMSEPIPDANSNSMPPPTGVPTTPPIAPKPMDDAQRQASLAQAVARSVAGGARVESHAPYQAIVVTGNKVNHTLHLILTLVTCGGWGLVWIALALIVKEKRTVLTIDPYGNVLSQ